MSIEFIGIAATAPHSETGIASERADPVQPGYLEELARAHEEAGFDRVLVAHSSASPDGFTVADQVLARTQRLGVLLAHRPGFVAPTYAARKFATLDAFHPGRVALHVITGGDDADQARDGDLTDKVTRYRRTDEFLDVLRLEWTSATPFDYDGERLWTPIAKVTGAAGNSTALVGSYEQVAQALLRYVDLGVSTLLIRGFTPLADARDYGTLVRLVREQAGPAALVTAR